MKTKTCEDPSSSANVQFYNPSVLFKAMLMTSWRPRNDLRCSSSYIGSDLSLLAPLSARLNGTTARSMFRTFSESFPLTHRGVGEDLSGGFGRQEAAVAQARRL
ncbi:hypothetical protein CHARACLAT_029988 [Characodon lateralis]|uniref:Uncharacterized protein n=1 Tax=Characodon lateralis TaxID=208331 RepID=A0ABU7E4S4_9TELE|nr:hypothetical protein [Characodon lateralis]